MKVKSLTDFLQSIGLTFTLLVLAWNKLSNGGHQVLLGVVLALALVNGFASVMAYLMIWDFWRNRFVTMLFVALAIILTIAMMVAFLPKEIIG